MRTVVFWIQIRVRYRRWAESWRRFYSCGGNNTSSVPLDSSALALLYVEVIFGRTESTSTASHPSVQKSIQGNNNNKRSKQFDNTLHRRHT